MKTDRKLEYDFALSFAGKDRAQARRIFEYLESAGCRVFYDESESSSLWGKDLYQHLANVYSKRARFCIILISKSYKRKMWPLHELRNVEERALRHPGDYVLPVRVDSTNIPGITTSTAHLDLRKMSLGKIATLAIEKLVNSQGGTFRFSLGRIFRSEREEYAFAEYCNILRKLARKSRMLKISYVALNGSENLFFTPQGLDWLAEQRILVAARSLAIERVLFIDAKAFRTDPVYRWKIEKIHRSFYVFTKPNFRTTLISNSRKRLPLDLQLFHTRSGTYYAVIPNVSQAMNMTAESFWEVKRGNKVDRLINEIRGLIGEYFELPDHSVLLTSDLKKQKRLKTVTMKKQLCALSEEVDRKIPGS